MPVDHLAVMNLRGFVTLVDAVGGVEVTLEHPLRDEHAHIDLPAGTQRLDGRTALGFVRSRQGEILAGGTWTPDPEGAAGRQRRGGEVFRSLLRQLPRTLCISTRWPGRHCRRLAEARDACSTWRVFTTSVVDSQVSPLKVTRDAEDWVALANE